MQGVVLRDREFCGSGGWAVWGVWLRASSARALPASSRWMLVRPSCVEAVEEPGGAGGFAEGWGGDADQLELPLAELGLVEMQPVEGAVDGGEGGEAGDAALGGGRWLGIEYSTSTRKRPRAGRWDRRRCGCGRRGWWGLCRARCDGGRFDEGADEVADHVVEEAGAGDAVDEEVFVLAPGGVVDGAGVVGWGWVDGFSTAAVGEIGWSVERGCDCR